MLKLLNEGELYDEVVDILSEIKLLTGAILHSGEDMLDKQVRMIMLFLSTSPKFNTLSLAEIRHAFYMNQQGLFSEVYKHYNRELNAEFIGDVLLAYLKYKGLLYGRAGKDIKALIAPPPAKGSIKVPAEDWMRIIQEDYERYLMGEVEWIFNTSPKYFFLRKVHLIPFTSKEKWTQWYNRALAEREREVRRRPAMSEGARITKDRTLSIYDAIRETKIITREEHNSVMHKMRRMVYLKFFEIISYFNYKDIFNEIQYKKL